MNIKSDKKSLPNTYKMIKKTFWIDPYIVEHTHITFKQVQSNK